MRSHPPNGHRRPSTSRGSQCENANSRQSLAIGGENCRRRENGGELRWKENPIGAPSINRSTASCDTWLSIASPAKFLRDVIETVTDKGADNYRCPIIASEPWLIFEWRKELTCPPCDVTDRLTRERLWSGANRAADRRLIIREFNAISWSSHPRLRSGKASEKHRQSSGITWKRPSQRLVFHLHIRSFGGTPN